jgi:hypothetical protein
MACVSPLDIKIATTKTLALMIFATRLQETACTYSTRLRATTRTLAPSTTGAPWAYAKAKPLIATTRTLAPKTTATLSLAGALLNPEKDFAMTGIPALSGIGALKAYA